MKTITVTDNQFVALVGLLDIAIKQIGLRAFEEDVGQLIAAVQESAKQTKDVGDE